MAEPISVNIFDFKNQTKISDLNANWISWDAISVHARRIISNNISPAGLINSTVVVDYPTRMYMN